VWYSMRRLRERYRYRLQIDLIVVDSKIIEGCHVFFLIHTIGHSLDFSAFDGLIDVHHE